MVASNNYSLEDGKDDEEDDLLVFPIVGTAFASELFSKRLNEMSEDLHVYHVWRLDDVSANSRWKVFEKETF